jgi:dUTP pyrophosphatase
MDVRADFTHVDGIKLFTSSNEQRTQPGRCGGVWLEPGDRALIPTGIHADIPDDFALLIYPRSGTSWKQGLTITNSVGLVDSDYVEEIFVSLMNSSRVRQWINQDDRIAQLVLMPVAKMPIERITSKPEQKTDRAGGFGSTGNK